MFSNIFTRKRKIEARLSGIQVALSNRPSQSLIYLKKDLRREYAEVLRIKEEFWIMKSRVEVLVNGDRNTSFYHTSTIGRRIKNKIVSLRDGNGDWIGNETDVVKHVRDGFIALYTKGNVTSIRRTWQIPSWQVCLSDEDCAYLSEPISDQEIKNAIWFMKPFKALGPNGLHAGFFQRFWLLVSSSVIEVVQDVFHSGKVPKSLNKTLITLIPKHPSADFLSSYRPVNL